MWQSSEQDRQASPQLKLSQMRKFLILFDYLSEEIVLAEPGMSYPSISTLKTKQRRLYDPEPDVFPSPVSKTPTSRQPPTVSPSLTPPAGEDTQARTGIYSGMDSNVGALPMAFTYKPFPKINSAASIQKYGVNNPTRPYKVVAGYLEDGFNDYRHLLSLNTTVERVDKVGNEWVLALRKSNEFYRGEAHDYWWEEKYDAVVIATGHYAVPFVPAIWGIDETYKALPEKFEHSKSFRFSDNYVGKVRQLLLFSCLKSDHTLESNCCWRKRIIR